MMVFFEKNILLNDRDRYTKHETCSTYQISEAK